MAITIIGSPIDATPNPVHGAFVQVKETWASPWVTRHDLIATRMHTAAAGSDLGSCELRQHYGSVKQTHESDFAQRQPDNLMGWWVRVLAVAQSAPRMLWIGRIMTQGRNPFAPDAAVNPRGQSLWTAYEPAHLLSRALVRNSEWFVDALPRDVDWLPTFNLRDSFGTLLGNRTSTKINGRYRFGGNDLWSRADMAEWILAAFIDEENLAGPVWRLSGSVEFLRDLTDIVSIPQSANVRDALRTIIDPAMGLDFKITPIGGQVSGVDDAGDLVPVKGFEVIVFALQGDEASFRGVSLPRNPALVRISIADDKVLSRTVERSIDHKVGRIRVIGSRLVVCCTLRASDSTLRFGWTDALETAYKNVAGTDDVEADEIRKDDRFRSVYQRYVAEADWNHQFGFASPRVDNTGVVIPGIVDLPAYTGNWQNAVRRTLSWIPLREGYRYDTLTPTDENPTDLIPGLLPPQAWVWDETNERYLPSESAGLSVAGLTEELGILLSAAPNHRLALHRFDPDIHDSETDPEFDPAKMVVTLAFESDQRIGMTWQESSSWKPTEGQVDIYAPAELWYLAPGTVVGVNSNGTLIERATEFIIRNDFDRLAGVMAGAIARYARPRARAAIQFAGLLPWDGLIGSILSVVRTGTEEETIAAPITGIEWTLTEEPTTLVRTGYA